jgi:hypothetical protein
MSNQLQVVFNRADMQKLLDQAQSPDDHVVVKISISPNKNGDMDNPTGVVVTTARILHKDEFLGQIVGCPWPCHLKIDIM